MQKAHSTPIRLPRRAASTRTALLAGLSIAVVGGCAANVDSTIDSTIEKTAGAGGADSESVGVAAQEITAPSKITVAYGEWYWYQGWGPVNMSPWSTHICTLFKVSGSFRGAGESIRISKGSNGLWQLSGSSYQQGVLAAARCFAKSLFTASGSIERWISDEFAASAQAWDGNPCGWFGCTRYQGTAHTDMWLPDAMTFLTGIQGALDGGGEGVWTDNETAPWPAQVHAYTMADITNYLTARAHSFFVGVPHSGHIAKFYGPGSPYKNDVLQTHGYGVGALGGESGDTWLARSDLAMCYLTSIHGGFFGNGELVELTEAWDGQAYRWKLHATNGGSYPQSLGAGAYCYAYNQDW